MTESAKKSANRWIKHIIGGGITLLCLAVMAYQINLQDIVTAFENFQWHFLLFGVGSLAGGYVLRIIRWSIMLRATGASVGFTDCAAPFLGSITLNNILPLRLGDVIRALVFPRSMGIGKAAAASSLVVERLIDLLTLLICLAIGMLLVQNIAIPEAIKQSALFLSLSAFIFLVGGLLFSARLGKLFHHYADSHQHQPHFFSIYSKLGILFENFGIMLRPGSIFFLVLLSMLVWCGEASLFYFVLLGFGFDANPATALLVMPIATLSTLVPSSPGYVGPFHLAAFTAISLVGGTASQAGSYAILVHLSLWLPTTLAGAIAIWMKPQLFRSAEKNTRPEMENLHQAKH